MFKFVSHLPEGNLYGFGLTETNLNRLEFNNEPIFFDFGYAGHSELFGLILYFGQFKEPTDIAENIDVVNQCRIPFLDSKRGVTPKTLHLFTLSQSVVQKFRDVPFWGFETGIKITSPGDMQILFAGRDEQDIEKYLRNAGLIQPQTKRTYKGFGKRE